jgi:hypothetical protein
MKRLAIATTLLTSAIAVHQAAATPINVTANRFIQLGSDISGPIDGPLSPSTALGSFVDSLTLNLGDEETTADQDSNIAGSSFSGNGSSSIGFSVLEDENVSALSFFEVFFDLTSNHSYILNGQLLANVDGGRGLAFFELSGPSGLFFFARDFGSTPLSQSGTLGAGSYHLTVFSLMDRGETFESGSFMGGSSSYQFSLNLQEQGGPGVPEPGTLALLVMGLAIAGIRKRT